MSQNNSNNDSEQECQHQPNFIPPVEKSDNETGRRESGKAGDSPEEAAEKVAGKAKDVKPSLTRKNSNKRKREGKEERVHLQSQDLRKLKRKGGRKNVLSEKGNESHLPHHQMFPAVLHNRLRIRGFTYYQKIQGNTKRGRIQMEPPLHYGTVCQSPF